MTDYIVLNETTDTYKMYKAQSTNKRHKDS